MWTIVNVIGTIFWYFLATMRKLQLSNSSQDTIDRRVSIVVQPVFLGERKSQSQFRGFEKWKKLAAKYVKKRKYLMKGH